MKLIKLLTYVYERKWTVQYISHPLKVEIIYDKLYMKWLFADLGKALREYHGITVCVILRVRIKKQFIAGIMNISFLIMSIITYIISPYMQESLLIFSQFVQSSDRYCVFVVLLNTVWQICFKIPFLSIGFSQLDLKRVFSKICMFYKLIMLLEKMLVLHYMSLKCFFRIYYSRVKLNYNIKLYFMYCSKENTQFT